jgi:hypothetical protein
MLPTCQQERYRPHGEPMFAEEISLNILLQPSFKQSGDLLIRDQNTFVTRQLLQSNQLGGLMTAK